MGAGDRAEEAADDDKNGAGDGTEEAADEETKKCKQNERDVTARRYRLYDMTPPGDTGLMQ